MDVLILAGGEARRLGGADKPMVEIGGRTLLDRVIEACMEAVHGAPRHGAAKADLASATAVLCPPIGSVIVVGPIRLTRHTVQWVREDPPGGGPVAAIATGLAACSAPYVGVFAADLPFLNAATVHSLWTTLADSPDHDGAVAVDEDGREQWLTAVYRHAALAARLAEHGAGTVPLPNTVRGLPLRRLVKDLRLLRIAPIGQAVLDCDTWEDVAAARRIAEPAPRAAGAAGTDPGDERD